MRLFLLTLVFLGANSFLFSPDTSSLFGRRPTNCAWLPWKYAGCVMDQRGNLRIQEKREKIPAQFGGKPCAFGPDEKLTSRRCSKLQFTVSSVIRAMGTVTIQKTKKPQPANRPTSGRPSFQYRPAFGLALQPSLYITSSPIPVCQEREFVDNITGIKLTGKNCTLQQPSRRRKRNDQRVESIEHRDVLFLVDESGSIKSQNFDLEKNFVKVLAGKFCEERRISRERTRVALTTFASGYKHHFDFDDYSTLSGVKTAVNAVPYGGGGTCLVKALRAVRTEMFISAKGSRVRNINSEGKREADGVIVLLTDGCFNCEEDSDYAQLLREEQALLQDLGIFVMAFMITVDDKCEKQYRNLQDGSACFQGIKFNSWVRFQSYTQFTESNSQCIRRWYENKVEAGEQPCGE